MTKRVMWSRSRNVPTACQVVNLESSYKTEVQPHLIDYYIVYNFPFTQKNLIPIEKIFMG